MKTEGTNILLLTISASWSSSPPITRSAAVVIPLSWCDSVYGEWVTVEWLARRSWLWVSVFEVQSSWAQNDILTYKQSHNWRLPCCCAASKWRNVLVSPPSYEIRYLFIHMSCFAPWGDGAFLRWTCPQLSVQHGVRPVYTAHRTEIPR